MFVSGMAGRSLLGDGVRGFLVFVKCGVSRIIKSNILINNGNNFFLQMSIYF